MCVLCYIDQQWEPQEKASLWRKICTFLVRIPLEGGLMFIGCVGRERSGEG